MLHTIEIDDSTGTGRNLIALLRDLAKSNKGIRVLEEESFEPMTLNELNDRIDRSMADAAEGRLTSVNELRKEAKKW